MTKNAPTPTAPKALGLIENARAQESFPGELDDWLQRGFSAQEFIVSRRRAKAEAATQRAIDDQPAPASLFELGEGCVAMVAAEFDAKLAALENSGSSNDVRTFLDHTVRVTADWLERRARADATAPEVKPEPIASGYQRTPVYLPSGVMTQALAKALPNWKIKYGGSKVPVVRCFVQYPGKPPEVEYIATEWMDVWNAIRAATDKVLDVKRRERTAITEQQRLAAWEAHTREQQREAKSPLGEIPIF